MTISTRTMHAIFSLLLYVTVVYGSMYFSVRSGIRNKICHSDDRVFEVTGGDSVSLVGCVFSCMIESDCYSVFWGAVTGCTGCRLAYSDDQSNLLDFGDTTYAEVDIGNSFKCFE